MNLRPRMTRTTELNIAITPLIDVVLVLLIFFMVSTKFKDDTQLHLQLPTAQGDATPVPPAVIRIVIDAQGQFFVNEQAVTPAQPLPALLAAQRPTTPTATPPPVLIQADARTPHQAVMTALDAASHAGFHRVAFAAIHPD